ALGDRSIASLFLCLVYSTGAAACAMLNCMRDLQAVEEELYEISAIPDDSNKLERIVVWCATHPDEIPLAIHLLMTRGKSE
ncbi:MAG: hypothetical protein JWO80_6142, partial [Bryobacterales bacterium]|nr:hypothetical protein [Bryobacterales bacterium]